MAANRISRIAAQPSAPVWPKNAPAIFPPGFVVCPPQVATAQSWQQEIYRQAYAQAQAAQVPRHYRLLFSVWN